LTLVANGAGARRSFGRLLHRTPALSQYDFYSGIIFRALGLPPAMFTPVFAVARTVGWVAHWKEMIADPGDAALPPRQLYTGPAERPLVPLAERAAHRPLVG
jgi:citrate synthase